MTAIRFMIGLAILMFLVTVGLRNMEPQVAIHYYFGYNLGPMPFFFALVTAAAAGVLLTMFFAVIEQLRLHGVIRGQRKQLAALERDLAEVKQLMPEHLIEQNLKKPSAVEGEKR